VELRYHPEALVELRESADYYSARSLRASQQFAAAVDRAVDAIHAEPFRFGRVNNADRARRVERFPFQIIYRVLGDVLFIVAVAHAKRRPGYWKRRK
jgi:toxin ParE1/3/4